MGSCYREKSFGTIAEQNSRVLDGEEGKTIDSEVLCSNDSVKVCYALRLFVLQVENTNGENIIRHLKLGAVSCMNIIKAFQI